MDSRAQVPSFLCSPKKNSRTINSPIFRVELFNSFGISFFPTIIIIVAASAFHRSTGYQARPSHAFSILSNFPSLETADCKTIQNASHIARTFRPSKLVLCALHVNVVHTEIGRPPATNPTPPSQRPKAIKVYSTFSVTISYGLAVGAPFFFFHFFFVLLLFLYFVCVNIFAFVSFENCRYGRFACDFLPRSLYLSVFLGSEIVKTF